LGSVLLFACSASESATPVAVGGAGGTGGLADASPIEGGVWGGTAGSGGSAAASVDAAPQAEASTAVPSCGAAGPLDCSASAPASYECGDPPATFAKQVNAALELVLAQNPAWFDESQGAAPCCPLALMPGEFMNAVVTELNAAGLCATLDPNNPTIEIVVKHDSTCSEQYVLLTSAMVVRHPPKFQGSCAPAWL
jgi:hypothetical protein